MSEPGQLRSASLAKDAVYKTGLRSFMEYRDLGIGMELVVLAGQYRMIAGVLFAFDTPLPEGESAPF